MASPLDFIELLDDSEAADEAGGAGPSAFDGAAEAASEHWSSTRRYHDTHSLELLLHEELLDFSEAFRPTWAEKAARSAAVERVRALLARCQSLGSATLHTFGSFSTGVYLPSSDVDLVVLDSGRTDKAGYVAGLREIEAALHVAPWRAEDIEVIATAKVPIVKFLDGQSGLSIDICLETRDGLKSSALARKADAQFPAFRHLVLVLKRFLISRGLNDTFTGGVGSFLLQLLVISSLQQPALHPPPHAALKGNLGGQLLHFFETFGMRLNTAIVGLRVSDGGRFFDKRQVSIYLSIYIYLSISVHIYIYLSIYLSIYMSISIYLYICLSLSG